MFEKHARASWTFGSIRALAAVVLISAGSAYSQDLSRVMVDLSQANSEIPLDSNTVSKEHFEIVMVQLTLGHVTGPKDINADFERRQNQISQIRGLRMGAYHLLTQSAPGSQQAKEFIDNLNSRCIPGASILLAVDWEKTCFHRSSPRAKCDREGYTEPRYLRDFLDAVRASSGVTPVVFTGLDTISTYQQVLRSDKDINKKLTSAALWLAQYNLGYTPTSGQDRGKAFLGYIFPRQSSFNPWSDWTFWQFAGGGDVGPTRRISASLRNQPADLSFFNGTREEFKSFFNRNAWKCSRTG